MKIPGLRWVIAFLMFAETLLAYLDLQELSVLAPVLGKQIGMSTSQYAFVTQGFLVAYTITFILGGRVIDRLGVRWGLGLSLFAWSTANALHALAHTPNELAAFRFLLGIVYPGAFLAGARAVSEWYPAEERAFVYGIFVSGAMVGSIVAYPMVVWLSTQWSWRAPFLVTGSIGILLGAVWLLVYRRPEHHPWVTDRELEHVRKGKATEELESAWRWTSLLKTRTFWAVAIGRFISDSTWMFYVLWLPKFLTGRAGTEHGASGPGGLDPFPVRRCRQHRRRLALRTPDTTWYGRPAGATRSAGDSRFGSHLHLHSGRPTFDADRHYSGEPLCLVHYSVAGESECDVGRHFSVQCGCHRLRADHGLRNLQHRLLHGGSRMDRPPLLVPAGFRSAVCIEPGRLPGSAAHPGRRETTAQGRGLRDACT